MTGLMILANGFEDTEALTTRDVLIRAGLNVITCSITDSLEVESSFGVLVNADCLLKKIKDLSNYDFIILPGGMKGTMNLKNCEFLKAYLDYFVLNNKLVCAICAAPSILGMYGYLENKKYTCYPGFNRQEYGFYSGEEVCEFENFITARSMNFSVKFGLEIIKKLLDFESSKKVENAINGIK